MRIVWLNRKLEGKNSSQGYLDSFGGYFRHNQGGKPIPPRKRKKEKDGLGGGGGGGGGGESEDRTNRVGSGCLI